MGLASADFGQGSENAILDVVHWQCKTDASGGTDEDMLEWHVQFVCKNAGHLASVLESLRTGARGGIARVDDDSLRFFPFVMLKAEFYGRGGNLGPRGHAGSGPRCFGND